MLNDPFDCAVPIGCSPVNLEACTRLLQSKEGQQWGPIRANPQWVDQAGRATEALRAAVERSGRSVMEDFERNDYSERGITCFSEAPDNTLLWSHYGDGHRGICLEFDTASPWLAKLHKVVYTDDIPQVNIVDLLLGDESQVLVGLLTKASCWSYEREWRAIHRDAGMLYCYSFEALTAVYLGAKLSPAEKDLVAHTLHGAPTQLYEIRRGAASFRLHAEPVDYTPFKFPSPNRLNDR